MFEFRWTKMYLQLVLLLHFAGVTRQDVVSVIVQEGGDVTLPCRTVTNDLRNCASTDWSFSPKNRSSAKQLVVQRQTDEKARAEPDRLSVTENCSLVVKKVTVKDVGRYLCNGNHDLSVVKVTEHKDDGKVTLNCSVWTRGKCRHTVKWLFRTGDVGPDHSDLKITQSDCSSNVTFKTSHYIYTSKKYDLLKCDVTDGYNSKVQQFTFNSEPSGSGNKETPTNAERDIPQQPLLTDLWWLYVVAAVGSAALLITVVALVRRKRKKANKTQREENMADPEDVSYVSVTFNKNTNSKARVRGADEAVTYSTVKTPSSSAGASIDPKSLYATIN